MNATPLIQAEGLYKIYKVAGVEVVALQGLDLEVAWGEFVALVGPSGSGKSTLLSAIGGLDRPSAGRLRVDGADLLAMSPSQLTAYRRRQVGFVWQQTARNLLPALSARENVELLLALDGRPRHAGRAWADEMLEAVGMAEHAGRSLAQLSGGQQQRVAIAAALAARPRILLGDEPTGEVDWPTARSILDLLRELGARFGLTVIVVTHDDRVAAEADRVVAIRDGRVSGERRNQAASPLEVAHGAGTAGAHGELTVIDSAGRLQLPAELRARAGLWRRAQVELAGNALRIIPCDAPPLAEVPQTPGNLPPLAHDPQPQALEVPTDLVTTLYPDLPGRALPDRPAITLQDVERSFDGPGGRVLALGGVSLDVPHGALVALTGPSGSGKTTLLNLVAALDSPTAGSVNVLGADLSALDEEARATLRRRLGLVFQSFALLPSSSAYENVELGLRLADGVPRSEWAGRIRACLEAMGLWPWAHHRVYELSGGQQQRVAIARALAPGPELIVADEPTGDLDPATGRRVLGLLRSLSAAGVTILLATHDPAVVAVASYHLELRDGHVVSAGPAATGAVHAATYRP